MFNNLPSEYHERDTNVSRSYAVNGLNQYTSAGPATFSYDANGNLTGDGFNTYTYDIENRLIGRSGGAEAALFYDPLGRLAATNGAPHLAGNDKITRFLYDGDALVAEYDGSGTLIHRYMHGPGVDEPILWDIGQAMNCSGTRFLHTNHQGSIVAVADCNGNRTAINSYDEHGIPAGLISGSTPNSGRFGYTGQTWIPEVGLWYYKARFYSPLLGRFMQTDPIGYEGGINIYAYAENDPVNNSDPSGLITAGSCEGDKNGNVSASCSGGNVIAATDAFRGQQANTGANRGNGGTLGRAVDVLKKAGSDTLEALEDAGDQLLNAKDDVVGAITEDIPDAGREVIRSVSPHAQGRIDEGRAGNARREVGDRNRLVREGRAFLDTTTGNTVYIKGNRAVFVSENGVLVSVRKMDASDRLSRIRRGRLVEK